MSPEGTEVKAVKAVLSDWELVTVERVATLWRIRGVYQGDQHVGVAGTGCLRDDPVVLARDMDALARLQRSILKAPPAAPQAAEVSPELRALLEPDEPLNQGKARLLREYDVLTQRLLDDRYVVSAGESARHEAISAILLELRR